METENDELHRLIESAKPAMDQDAAYVALGLQTRVMANLESSSRSEDALSQWGSAFLRGAFVSVTVALALGGWAWFQADLSVSTDWALSALVQDADWPSPQILP
ncbi:MAG: hypothetical protein AAGH89_14255 [Verrucomicrobiota bacterium]